MVRLGKLFYLAKQLDSFQDTVKAEAEDVVDTFNSTDMWQIPQLTSLATSYSDQASIGQGTLDASGNYVMGETYNPTRYLDSLHGQLATAARKIVTEAVRTGLGLSVGHSNKAIELLIRDMIAQGHYVDENTVGAVSLASVGGMTGNGTVITSQNMPSWQMGGSDKKWQTTRAEAIEIKCNADESSGVRLGAESFRLTGKSAYPKYSCLWPDGSAANKIVRVTSAGYTSGTSGEGKNLLYNSDFNIWTSATACDKWTFSQTGNNLAHTAGGQGGALSNDTERTTTTYGSRGTYNIQFNGNNSCKHLIQQKMGNNADGTIGTVRPSAKIVFSMRIKAHTTTITSGVLRVSLWDGTSSRLSGCSSTVDFSSANLTSSWTHFSGVWDVSEKAVPVDLRFGIDFSTAIQADRSLQLGELIIANPTQAYDGGPGFVIVRGTTDFRVTDEFNATFTNNYASDFQLYFDKYLKTSELNLNLPVAGSGTAFTDSGYIT